MTQPLLRTSEGRACACAERAIQLNITPTRVVNVYPLDVRCSGLSGVRWPHGKCGLLLRFILQHLVYLGDGDQPVSWSPEQAITPPKP